MRRHCFWVSRRFYRITRNDAWPMPLDGADNRIRGRLRPAFEMELDHLVMG
jgi:hypothetical protein